MLISAAHMKGTMKRSEACMMKDGKNVNSNKVSQSSFFFHRCRSMHRRRVAAPDKKRLLYSNCAATEYSHMMLYDQSDGDKCLTNYNRL